MHMSENYLSPSTCIVLDIIFVVLLIIAIKKTRASIPRERMLLLGFVAAVSCVVMMVDLPVSGGTSAHAICGAIIAILFGPWAAVVAVTVALFVQAILFGDGGLLCLGANGLIMAFVLPFVAYGIYWVFSKIIKGLRGELVGGFIGSYIAFVISALLSAVLCSLQPLFFHDSFGNALYAPYPLTVAIPSILANALALWAFVEAILTCVLLVFFRKKTVLFPVNKVSRKVEVDKKNLKPIVVLCLVISLIVPVVSLCIHSAFGIWTIDTLNTNVGYIPAGIKDGWSWSGLLPSYTLFGLPHLFTYILSGVFASLATLAIFKLISFGYKPLQEFCVKSKSNSQIKEYDEYIYEVDNE